MQRKVERCGRGGKGRREEVQGGRMQRGEVKRRGGRHNGVRKAWRVGTRWSEVGNSEAGPKVTRLGGVSRQSGPG